MVSFFKHTFTDPASMPYGLASCSQHHDHINTRSQVATRQSHPAKSGSILMGANFSLLISVSEFG